MELHPGMQHTYRFTRRKINMKKGSVISCPGSADQAMHADTPHLFDHAGCLPCHYANVITPGYDRQENRQHPTNGADTDNDDDELDADENWTDDSSMGGTAFVEGSQGLSVSAMLTSKDDEDGGNNNADDELPLARRDMLRLRTVRPALEAGEKY